MNKAIFLDRDGTIIIDKNYLVDESQIEFIKGIPEVLKKLKSRGYLLLVVTNQSGVARGFYNESTVNGIHKRMNHILNENYGFTLDGFFYCPHHPDFGNNIYCKRCDCRKPAPGMVLKAAKKFQIDINKSFMIGDKMSDKIDLPNLKFIKVQKNSDWTKLIEKQLSRTGLEVKTNDI